MKNNRIAIIGTPGSGKSTLALRLGSLLNIPVHHLDTYVFVNGKKASKATCFQIQEKLVAEKSWVIEGCSFSALEMRCKKADLVIFLDIPRFRCLWRVLKRSFTCDKNLANSGCIRFPNWTLLKYIWNFEKNKKPQIYALKKQYPQLDCIIFRSSEEVESFLQANFYA